MRVIVGFATVLLLLVSVSCNKEESDPSLRQYLFLEQHLSVSGELVSGSELPAIQIDFPTYTFNQETGELTGVIDFSIDNNLKMIYGSGTSLSGTAGAGVATGLSGVYEIPYERGSFELLKLDDDGNVVFMYKDDVHSLKSGEIWTYETEVYDTLTVDNQVSISKITSTDRITNFGFQDKNNIRKWEW